MSNKPRERLRPDVRAAQIVEVAAEHFARDGVAGASTIAIARDAGVTRALVYRYFPGREALLEAVLRRESDQLLAATEPDPALTVGANLRRALTAYLDSFAASRGALRELYSPASAVPAVRELAHANHLIHLEWLLDQTGRPDTPQARLAIGGWLAFVEFVARQSVDSPDIPRGDVIELCVAALEGALGQRLDPQPHATTGTGVPDTTTEGEPE